MDTGAPDSGLRDYVASVLRWLRPHFMKDRISSENNYGVCITIRALYEESWGHTQIFMVISIFLNMRKSWLSATSESKRYAAAASRALDIGKSRTTAL